MGFEPMTSSLQMKCSARLSYAGDPPFGHRTFRVQLACLMNDLDLPSPELGGRIFRRSVWDVLRFLVQRAQRNARRHQPVPQSAAQRVMIALDKMMMSRTLDASTIFNDMIAPF